MAEIPFWIHDRPKWVSGISKHTTCQDVLLALVKAERKSKPKGADSAGEDDASKEISRQLALVEQWRGVERPLSNSSKILKLWNAWGEERKEVKFLVKRISMSSRTPGEEPPVAGGRSRKPRRRTSRASSIASQCQNATPSIGDFGYKKMDTLHPNALKSKQGGSKLKSHEIERLMRIILVQGETIHSQLKKLQEREFQIETIEQKVHDKRTKTAGKDYVIKSYLKQLPDGETSGSERSSFGDALEAIPERLQEMLEALTKVYNLNEEIQKTEDKISDLRCQIDASDSSQSLEVARSELQDLKSLNDARGKEIDLNRQKIDSMKEAFEARQAIVQRLERDMGCAEKEGLELEQQLREIEDRRQQTIDFLQRLSLANPDLDDELDDEPILYSDSVFLRPDTSSHVLPSGGNFLNDGHFRISNEELYSVSSTQPPRVLYDQLQRRLHVKTSTAELEELHIGCTDRITATGSPGSASSSGNSSGGGGSEKSVRFSDRDHILSTPELVLPQTKVSAGASSSPAVPKSALKSMSDPSGDTDSNSDTGLSSLHSSSDEGTYILDTLV